MRAAQLAARIVNIFNAHFEKTLDELSAGWTRLGNKTNKINSSTLLQIVYFRHLQNSFLHKSLIGTSAAAHWQCAALENIGIGTDATSKQWNRCSLKSANRYLKNSGDDLTSVKVH